MAERHGGRRSNSRRKLIGGVGLILTTLGGAALQDEAEGEARRHFGPGKPLALLAYLACAPERTAPRDRLIDLLWSDSQPDAGQHNLRQTLWYIRQRTGEIVTSRRDDLVLAPAVKCDRDAFLGALERRDAEQAVAFYGGEFLPRGGEAGAHVFEGWADRERYRLRRLFARTAESVAQCHLRAGRFAEAEQVARRVRDADIEEESGWRLLLETLLLAREHGRAASEADVLEWELAVRGREPEPETRELVRRIRHAPPTPAGHSGLPEPRLVGREEQLTTLLRAWDRTTRGRGAHLDIVAAAGCGKTRFLAESRARLEAVGATTVSLAANPATREVSHVFASNLAAAVAALPGSAGVSEATATALVALDPALSSRYPVAADSAVGDEATRRRLLALVELLAATSEERPLALLLDDVHWADAGSRQILDGLLGSLERMHVLVVTAARPPGRAHTSIRISKVVHLPPLSVADVHAVLTDLGALPNAPWAERLPVQLASLAAGSPLVLLDVLQRALDKGLFSLGREGWSCPSLQTASAELAALGAQEGRPTESHPRSILVMPFSAQDTGEVESLSDGLTEDLIAALSRVEALRVVAWASARKLKGTERTAPALANELNVRYVLRGELRASDAGLDLRAELIKALDGSSVWQTTWCAARDQMAGMAADFSRQIAEALLVTLTPAQTRRGSQALPGGRAYECYLRAREVMSHDLTLDRLQRAKSLLRLALKASGENALLYATLGAVHAQYGLLTFENNRTLRRIEACARKALSLDSESAEAHFLRGLAECRRNRLREGVHEMLLGLAINPHHTDALFWCSGWLCSLGKTERARPLVQRLLETDPLTSMNLCMPGWVEWLSGRFQDAIPWYRRWLATEPQNPATLHTSAMCMIWNQRFDEARELLKTFASITPASPWALYNQLIARALEGDRGGTLAALTPRLEAVAGSFEVTCWYVATFCAMVDARDEAVAWVERAVQRGFINYPMLAEHDPFLTRLRGDARYERVLGGVKQEWEALQL